MEFVPENLRKQYLKLDEQEWEQVCTLFFVPVLCALLILPTRAR